MVLEFLYPIHNLLPTWKTATKTIKQEHLYPKGKKIRKKKMSKLKSFYRKYSQRYLNSSCLGVRKKPVIRTQQLAYRAFQHDMPKTFVNKKHAREGKKSTEIKVLQE